MSLVFLQFLIIASLRSNTTPKLSGTFRCTKCSAQLNRKNDLLRHMKELHRSESSRRFKCPDCNARFKRRTHLHSHLNRKPKCHKRVSDPPKVSTIANPQTVKGDLTTVRKSTVQDNSGSQRPSFRTNVGGHPVGQAVYSNIRPPDEVRSDRHRRTPQPPPVPYTSSLTTRPSFQKEVKNDTSPGLQRITHEPEYTSTQQPDVDLQPGVQVCKPIDNCDLSRSSSSATEYQYQW